jgi:hypothetical protein
MSNYDADQRQASTFHVTHLRIKLKQRVSPKWQSEQVIRSLAYRTTWYGTSIRKRSLEMFSGL